MIRNGQANLQLAREPQGIILEAEVTAAVDRKAPIELAILNNAIAEADFQQNVEVPIEMTDSEKTQHSKEWRSYRERNAKLQTHRGQAFSLILGQCTQLLQDRMKQDTDGNTVSTSYDRGPIPVRHHLRPGTSILLVPTELLVKPAMV
jgi:hypothetical protein